MVVDASRLNLINMGDVDEKKVSIGSSQTEEIQNLKQAYRYFIKSKESAGKEAPTYAMPEQDSIKEELDNMFEDMDGSKRKQQMEFIANTMTIEDYQKIIDCGLSLESDDTDGIVTEMDKIKMTLAQAGKDISCFGDDPNMEQIKAVFGDSALAQQVAEAFQKNDIPVTEENLKDVKNAIALSEELNDMGDGAVKYMLDEQLEPTIYNVYMAENNGSIIYNNRSIEQFDISSLESQIEEIINEADLENTQQIKKDAIWIINNGILLTPQNIKNAEELKNISLPMDQEKLLSNMAVSISEGKRAVDALLIEGYSIEEKRENVISIIKNTTDADLYYVVKNNMKMTISNIGKVQQERLNGKDISAQEKAESDDNIDLKKGISSVKDSASTRIENTKYDTSGNNIADIQSNEEIDIKVITARRQLEEVRLYMTSSATYTLMRSGIDIDTTELEKLVSDLKQIEQEYYGTMLQKSGVDPTENNVSMFKQTVDGIDMLKIVPCYTLGMTDRIPTVDENMLMEEKYQAVDLENETPNTLLQKGLVLKETLDKAFETYEALKTRPNKELNDSITKAFGNIDEILEDLGMEATKENQRAVRILAYNQTSIDSEAIMRIKEADKQVQTAFNNLKPSVVIEFIRRGINPMDMNIDELNSTANEIQEEMGNSKIEKFSEYLYHLEKNDDISKDERDAYIGIYRLISQVEKTDGAVIGNLVNQGAEITMRKLMNAVRSSKTNNIEYVVDDTTDLVESKVSNTIATQIDEAYHRMCMSELLKKMSPERFEKVTKEDENWQDMSLEQFKDLIEDAETEQEDMISREYAQAQLDTINEVSKESEQIYNILRQYELPNTVENLVALKNMMTKRNVFKKIFEDIPYTDDETMTELKEATIKKFAEAIKTPEELAKAQEELAETAEQVMEGMYLDSDDVNYLNIKEMKLAATQLRIAEKMSKNEFYSVPIMVGDEVANMSLKIVRGEEKKGKIEIMFETSKVGKIAAEISASAEKLQGYILTQDNHIEDILNDNMSMLSDAIGVGKDITFDIVRTSDVDLTTFGTGYEKVNMINKDNESYEIQTSTLYGIAERFLKAIGKILAD